jgi:hypothetical protein
MSKGLSRQGSVDMRCVIKLALIVSLGLYAQHVIDRLSAYSPDWNIVLPPSTEEEFAAGLVVAHRLREEERCASMIPATALAERQFDLGAPLHWPVDLDPDQ